MEYESIRKIIDEMEEEAREKVRAMEREVIEEIKRASERFRKIEEKVRETANIIDEILEIEGLKGKVDELRRKAPKNPKYLYRELRVEEKNGKRKVTYTEKYM